jgi:hypothetical protein
MSACVLLLSLVTTLMPASAFAEAVPAVSSAVSAEEGNGGTVDLYALSTMDERLSQQHIVVAAQDRTESPVPSVQKGDRDCCGNFWDVHFGGYRWVWWALAGAGLIAIHAN